MTINDIIYIYIYTVYLRTQLEGHHKVGTEIITGNPHSMITENSLISLMKDYKTSTIFYSTTFSL